jgi:predicted N-acetyltransferase YhbS
MPPVHPHTLIRLARPSDVPALRALIAVSVRGLGTTVYTKEQIEAALVHVFGVDTQLIEDGTYYVAEDEGRIIASGGWSGRRLLFGGDQVKTSRAEVLLDPATEPARIRAFFVHPTWARRGLGRRLFERCEAAAAAAGFRRFELMATLPGEPLYAALGFASSDRVDVPMPGGLVLPCVRMERTINAEP